MGRIIYTTGTDGPLTESGVTEAIEVASYSRLSCVYTVANINTNVVIRLEGSVDGSDPWVPLVSDVTATENGSYLLSVNNLNMQDVRFRLVSESGGTTATIAIKWRLAV